jgi:transcriptional regulator with XRE-family HTH domain
MTTDWLKPQYRFKLKAEIVRCGYRTLSEFASEINCPQSILSRVVCGYELPSPSLANRIAEALGIDLKNLRELMEL